MYKKFEQPIVTVDVVLLTLIGEQLCVALLQREHEPFAGKWTLPGGFVHANEDENALDAAVRILRDKAAVESPYLEQLQTFASRTRDPRGWSVSIAYYALVAAEQVPGVRVEAGAVRWRPVDAIRSLPFDHLEILHTAVDRVRSKTSYSSLPVYLMGPTFTLTELQRTYERVLGHPIDKRGFRRRIEELDVVEPAAGIAEGRAHRPAQLYRLKRRLCHRLALADKTIGAKE